MTPLSAYAKSVVTIKTNNGAPSWKFLFAHENISFLPIPDTRILKISFANIREVTDRIELNFGMCIANSPAR